MIKKIQFTFLLLLLCVSTQLAQKPVKDLKPTVILISIDGFRYDYFEKFQPVVLNKLARDGVRAKWMMPSFPTKTFPNHYTVATGLYPEHHGIIENNIWDFGVTFRLNIREEVQNPRWWLGEPIWVTAEKQNQRAGAFFFPGTEAEIGGVRPTFWKQYDGKIPNEERVDTVLSWLDLPPNERPTIYTLYFSDVDDAGHGFGPDSVENKNAVLKVDTNIKRLMDGLKARKIDKKVNVIITSDHGMAAVDQRNAIVMDDYLDSGKTERVLTTGEIYQIFPKPGREEEIMAGLKPIQHATCWRKSEIPERLHYRDSPRIAPVVCSADEGWFMTSRERYETQNKRADFGQTKGAHGYDNKYESMRAIFVGHGKAFRKRRTVEAFENIHVYELMCEILGLTPAKNDGDLKRVKGMLR
ncbi:MAG: ectonucleotide pyrophosphatase/phosphodiesterase [Pyrinomonadaceae bacterium]